ncbi:helix-turn-helix domain-containing protein [Mycobacterium senriense]|uniref:helix-turn-helix domain-containing protein n=1 Tax=Mycobacterium senriense TaxID=2775496 RepID=UPI001C82231D|nr:helix-turn-helix domain-containing protein [Mycobacterium senriense]
MSDTEPIVVGLTATEVTLLLFGTRDLMARCVFGGRPLPRLPRGFDTVHARLVSSVRGTKTCAPQPQSSRSAAEDLIDSTDAAEILHCSERWVRDDRFRDRIGGRNVGGRWVFPRQTVVQYAERKVDQR